MLNIKPTHKPIKNYYAELERYATLGAQHEGAVRVDFLFWHAVCLKSSDFFIGKLILDVVS